VSLNESPLYLDEQVSDSVVIRHIVIGYEVHLRERGPDVFVARVEWVGVLGGEPMHSAVKRRWQYEVKPSRQGARVTLVGIVCEADLTIYPSGYALPQATAYLREVAKVAWQLRASTKKWSVGRPLDSAFGALAKPFEQTRRERRAAGTAGPRPATKPPPKRSEHGSWDGPDFAPFTPFTPFGSSTARPKPAAAPPKPPPQARVSEEDRRRAAEAFERIARRAPTEPSIPRSVRAALGVLELPADVLLTPEALKAAWRTAARTTHPDKGGSKPAFVAARDAYDEVTRALSGPRGPG